MCESLFRITQRGIIRISMWWSKVLPEVNWVHPFMFDKKNVTAIHACLDSASRHNAPCNAIRN